MATKCKTAIWQQQNINENSTIFSLNDFVLLSLQYIEWSNSIFHTKEFLLISAVVDLFKTFI